jgi:hypothetical protein
MSNLIVYPLTCSLMTDAMTLSVFDDVCKQLVDRVYTSLD